MRAVILLGASMLLAGCLEQMELPDPEKLGNSSFGAGDTTYLPVSPVWGSDLGLVAPVEVSISHAQHIFVADTGIPDIAVFSQYGERLDLTDSTFATLDIGSISPDFRPMDLDIDGRLNLLFIDGSNKVYRWNQFWNIHGIDSVATEILFQHVETGEFQWVDTDSPFIYSLMSSPQWYARLDSSHYSADQAVIDSLLYPHVFFDMASPINEALDIFPQPQRTTFSAISAGRLDDMFFYVADSLYDRLIIGFLLRNGAVKLGNGETYFTHIGIYAGSPRQEGTGAGFINQPTGLDVDAFGNIYYTQLGEFIYVHSVTREFDHSSPSRFVLNIHDIMDPGQYSGPFDVAVDMNQMIYVANTGGREVLVFDGAGQFFRKAGIQKIIVDTTLWVPIDPIIVARDTLLWINDSTQVDTTLYVVMGTDSALVDTFFFREIHGELQNPISVDVDDQGVIYICDPDQSSVLRYTLSTSFDEDQIPQN